MTKYYRLTAEFDTEEQAKIAQDWIGTHFHCGELLWNSIKEIQGKEW